MDKLFRIPLHNISGEQLIDIPYENTQLLKQVLQIHGIFDYLDPKDLINFFHAFMEFKAFQITFKRKYVLKRFKSIKIKTGLFYFEKHTFKPYQYKINLQEQNLPLLRLDLNEMEDFMKQYGPLLKNIGIIKNFYEFKGFANNYHYYYIYCDMFDKSCNNLEAIIDRYKYSHIQIEYPNKMMSKEEIELIKIFLTNGLLKFLNNKDIFLFMQALKPMVIFSKFVFRNLLFTHINNPTDEFKNITIIFTCSNLYPSLAYSISNNQYFFMDNLQFSDLSLISRCIGKYVENVIYYHPDDFYDENSRRRDLIMKLIRLSFPKLISLKIISNRIERDSLDYVLAQHFQDSRRSVETNKIIATKAQKIRNDLKTKIYPKFGEEQHKYLIDLYPFLQNINIQIYRKQTDLFGANNPILLQNILSEQKESLTKVNISNAESVLILDTDHLKDILMLPKLNRLIMSTKYDILQHWENILEIKLSPIDGILESLEYLTIESKTNQDANYIENFFKNISVMAKINARESKILLYLNISNYHFVNCENLECSNYLQPNWLKIENCTFQDDMVSDTILKYFNNLESIEFVNSDPINISIFPNLSNMTHLIFRSCSKLTNQNMFMLYECCINVKVRYFE